MAVKPSLLLRCREPESQRSGGRGWAIEPSLQDIEDPLHVGGLTSIVKIKVLKRYGHTKRTVCGLSRVCLEGMVNGRSRDHQPKGWRDNVYEWINLSSKSMNTAAEGHQLWREIPYANEQSAAGGDIDETNKIYRTNCIYIFYSIQFVHWLF